MRIRAQARGVAAVRWEYAPAFTLYARVPCSIMPTQGFNIKSLVHEGFKLNVWDVGGECLCARAQLAVTSSCLFEFVFALFALFWAKLCPLRPDLVSYFKLSCENVVFDALYRRDAHVWGHQLGAASLESCFHFLPVIVGPPHAPSLGCTFTSMQCFHSESDSLQDLLRHSILSLFYKHSMSLLAVVLLFLTTAAACFPHFRV